MRKLGMSPAQLKAFILDLGDGPDLQQAHELSRPARTWPLSRTHRGRPSRRSTSARPSGSSRTTNRSTSSQRPWRIALCRGIRARYPEWRLPYRRRWRRREPQGLSHRREPRAHHPQRHQQSDALPGRLGRRQDQALADLQRRTQPLLRAHLRAGALHYGFIGFSPYTRPTSSPSPRAYPSSTSPTTTSSAFMS